MKWGNLTEDELKKGPEGFPPGPVFYQVGQADEAALFDELETLLEDAVRRQMVADVPVGILLSGEVDSSQDGFIRGLTKTME